MASPPEEVLSGARLKLFMNGVEVGRSTNIRVVRTWQLARVDAHGDPASKSIEVIGYTVSMTCATVVIATDSLVEAGVIPDGDSIPKLVAWPPGVGLIYDEVGDRPIMRVEGLQCENEDYDSPARGLLTFSGGWQGTHLHVGAAA